MNKMLVLALMASVACGKKQAEPEPAPVAAAEKAEPGMVDVGMKKIVAEETGKDGMTKQIKVTAELQLDNAGGMDVELKNVNYTMVAGEERSDEKMWEKPGWVISAGDSKALSLSARYSWEGAGEVFPHDEAQFDGTITYMTDGAEKTAPFKLKAVVEEVVAEPAEGEAAAE